MAEVDLEALSVLAGRIDFEVPELADLVAATLGESGAAGSEVVEDVPPDPQDGPCVARVGDVWACGRHRVMCGDSTDQATVAALLGDVQPDMAFTDPPWNVGIGTDKNPRHRQRPGLVNDSLSEAEFGRMLTAFAAALAKFVEGDVYCVLGSERWPLLDKTLRDAGFHWSATIIWVKDIFVLGRSKYHRRYEPIWYGWSTSSSFRADRKQDDVWEFARPKRSPEHPTMKPVELVARAIANSSTIHQSVLDPFLGSGTTLIAAEQLGRTCYGIEIEPKYVDVILQRYMNFTDESPVRESDGARFADMVTEEAVSA
ncbi:MAG: site-specific DNA-methyltransferase [Planctomycetes bacterium]|nr:site-specific DNA-methyltransferase [Planctomycetota bacterium]